MAVPIGDLQIPLYAFVNEGPVANTKSITLGNYGYGQLTECLMPIEATTFIGYLTNSFCEDSRRNEGLSISIVNHRTVSFIHKEKFDEL